MMFAAGFGWAKPVPVNQTTSKKPKQGNGPYGAGGAVSNFLLALLTLLAARDILRRGGLFGDEPKNFGFSADDGGAVHRPGPFNLVPIPPLDGSKVLFAVLPDRAYDWLMRNERYGMLLLFALVFFDVGSNALSKTIQWVFDLFCRMVGL